MPRPGESAGPPTFRRIFEAVLTAYGQRDAKPRIGEKTPGHVRYILLLEGAEAGVRTQPVAAWTGARKKLRRGLRRRVPRIGVRLGLPPSMFGYRWLERTTVPEYFDRHRTADGGRFEVVHDDTVVNNPLPCNIASRRQLPADKGWWGFSFSDVPARSTGATRIITLPDCRVAGREAVMKVDFMIIGAQKCATTTTPTSIEAHGMLRCTVLPSGLRWMLRKGWQAMHGPSRI